MANYKELDKLSEERYNEKIALMERELRKILSAFDLKTERLEQLTIDILYDVIAPIYFDHDTTGKHDITGKQEFLKMLKNLIKWLEPKLD